MHDSMPYVAMLRTVFKPHYSLSSETVQMKNGAAEMDAFCPSIRAQLSLTEPSVPSLPTAQTHLKLFSIFLGLLLEVLM